MLSQLVTQINAYLGKITAVFLQTRGPKGYGFYINNNDGRFSFDIEPIVAPKNIAMTTTDIDVIKADIETNNRLGDTAFDAVQLIRYEWTAMGWVETVVTIQDIVKPGRLYFSPILRKVYLVDETFKVNQFKESTP
jgi:hypothetical protein